MCSLPVVGVVVAVLVPVVVVEVSILRRLVDAGMSVRVVYFATSSWTLHEIEYHIQKQKEKEYNNQCRKKRQKPTTPRM